jgi:hypothetical protein
MINLQRTTRLIRFDLTASLFRLKGLFFLLPFMLFWYLILRITGGTLAGWLQQPDGLTMAGMVFTRAQLDILFIQNPPVLSVFLITALISMPAFAVLGGLDQYSTDLGRGYYRLLATRCRRSEMFIAGYGVSLLLVAGSVTLATLAATGVSIVRDARAIDATLLYAARIWLILVFYAAALLGFMSIVSVSTRSAMASLFLGVFGYLFMLLVAASLNTIFPAAAVFQYLLPSGLKPYLLILEPAWLVPALACLALYTAVYTWLAWKIFNNTRL